MEELTTIASTFVPKETMDRLESEIRANGMKVFARIDHRDVGTGTSDIFSFNDDRSHSLSGQGPGDVFTCFAAAQRNDIVLLRLCLHRFGDCSVLLDDLFVGTARHPSDVDIRFRWFSADPLFIGGSQLCRNGAQGGGHLIDGLWLHGRAVPGTAASMACRCGRCQI